MEMQKQILVKLARRSLIKGLLLSDRLFSSKKTRKTVVEVLSERNPSRPQQFYAELGLVRLVRHFRLRKKVL